MKTDYRGWNVYEIGPNTQGVAALMMLNLMERYPIGQFGFHSPDAMHVMIEAKKLAYADMLKYVGDPRFSHGSHRGDARQGPRCGSGHADRHDARHLPRAAGTSERRDRRAGRRHDLHVRGGQGRQHRLAHPEQLQWLRLRPGAAGHGLHAAEPRRPLLAREEPAEHAHPEEAAAPHHHSGLHGEGRDEDRLRHHGRLEPGPGPRAVRVEHRRPRLHDPAGAGGGPLHEGQLRRL